MLEWTEDEAANRLLASNDTALLIGMLLDQQFPMERAFLGPHLLAERLDIEIRPSEVIGCDPDAVEAAFQGPPAIHRFPNAMARRTIDLCRTIVDEYDGHASRIWSTADDAEQLRKRLESLPGYGRAKARIFVGILGKHMDVRPDGWEGVAADWPSIADVRTFEDVAELRAQKRAMKQRAKKDEGS